MARRSAVASLVLAAAAYAALLLIPTGRSVSATAFSTDSGTAVEEQRVEGITLIESEGLWVVALLAVPVLLAAAQLLRNRWARLAAAVGLTVFCLLGMASVGLPYVPAAIFAWWAARPDPITYLAAPT